MKKLPPLDQVEPSEAWKPWEPNQDQPWDRKWAGHLYRRAAFGATEPELRAAVKAGLPATLDRLFKVDAQRVKRDQEALDAMGTDLGRQDSASPLRAWWLYCMLNGPDPLREKLTLFWHNHFATSNNKVQQPGLMFKQNQTFRKNALGKFGTLLLEVSRDPAMLIWLDAASNFKGKANENYARELMELFSLGVGNYTENDIREAARAFTGWQVQGDACEFSKDLHDAGAKTVFGQKGNWKDEDIVRLVLKKHVCATFLVRKLYRYFISEQAVPPANLLQPLADAFRKSDYDIAGLMRIMLGSRHFFSEHAYRQRIKDPVELAVGAVRALLPGPVPPSALVPRLKGMGQELFAPPTVKGWDGGKTWLNTSTVLARHNFAQAVAWGNLPVIELRARGRFEVDIEDLEEAEAVVPGDQKGKKPPARKEVDPPSTLDAASLAQKDKLTDPARIADCYLDLLVQGGISKQSRQSLIDFIDKGKPKDAALQRRIREAIHSILTMPEYQLA